MKILISGCSFTSGWGFDGEKKNPNIWTNLVANQLECEVINIAETCNSNGDIFLATTNAIVNDQFDLVLVQTTALDRISTVIGPLSNKINLINLDQRGDKEVNMFSPTQFSNFKKIYTTFNHSWKHFFDLATMIDTYSKCQTPVAMINGLLPWTIDFWNIIDRFPTAQAIDDFTKDLVQFDQYPDQTLTELIQKVNQGKQTIQKLPWINLTHSWQCAKIDTVSQTDQHPGVLSQQLFANQVLNFIKENYA